MNKSRNKMILSVVGLLFLVIIVIGVSYAAFTYARQGVIENVVKTGTITMTYTDGKNSISIDNAMPIEDSVGKLLSDSDQVFDFTVSINIVGNQSIAYEVTAEKDEKSTLENNDVRIYLERATNPNGTYTAVSAPSEYVPLGEKDNFEAGANEMRLDVGNTSSTITYYYRLRMWVSKNYEITNISKFFTVRINVYGKDDVVIEEQDEVMSTEEFIKKKTNDSSITNYADGDTTKMYVFDHSEIEQASALTQTGLVGQPSIKQVKYGEEDYRYIGNNPANYVEFNDEIWRIIGIFEEDDGRGNYEKRMKIIRNTGIGKLPVIAKDENAYLGESEDKHKNWVLSDLNYLLANDYYRRSGLYSSVGLTAEAKKMIKYVKWYLGSPIASEGEHYLGALGFYMTERRENELQDTSSWMSFVGLMYVSDYAYTYGKNVSNGYCYNQVYACSGEEAKLSWLYNSNDNTATWTINAFLEDRNLGSAGGYVPFAIDYNGQLYEADPSEAFNVRPVVYLSPDVKIIAGDGTKNNVYKLSL